MHIESIEEVTTAIENHSALKLAGVPFPGRLHVLESRCHQLGGMIELARRIKAQRSLLNWLEAHRDALRREIEGE